MTGNPDTGPVRGHARRRRRRRGLGHRADRVPRRRRPVDDLLGRGRRGHLRRHRGLARPVEAGRRRSLRPADGDETRAGSRRSAAWACSGTRSSSTGTSSSSSSSARAGRTAATPTAARSCASRTRSRHPRVRRVREGRRGRDAARLGGDQLRPRDPALRRRDRRDAQDGLDLHVRQQQPRAGRRRPGAAAATWEDYEIEVVGQHYTIRRNGEVINEFENSPGKNSDRGGDPSTTLRQFARGLHRPPEPRRRGHDAVPQHPRRGPDAGRAEGRGRRPGRSTVAGAVRTRSRSARSTRPATQAARDVRHRDRARGRRTVRRHDAGRRAAARRPAERSCRR